MGIRQQLLFIMNRRKFIKRAGASVGSGLIGGAAPPAARGMPDFPFLQRSPEVILVGAGAFGGWTAYHLNKKGVAVTLLDAYGPGNSRASSGGETRLIQVDYGEQTVYIRTAIRAYKHWIELQESTGEQLVLPTGRLAMHQDTTFLEENREKIRQLIQFDITDAKILDQDEIHYRWPQIYHEDLAFALYNPGGPGGSTLMARKACGVVAREFEKQGGTFRIAVARPVFSGTGRMEGVRLSDGSILKAQQYVFACGSWLPKLFPELLGKRLQVQRRDVLFHGVPPGDPRFSYPNLPEWSVQGSGWYGFPDIDNRGLKAAPYPDLNSLDPDTDERLVTPQQAKRAHDFIGHRFPALAGHPLTEGRVCQVTNSADMNFIVDRHPEADNVWIAGGGSGHGFKHGPAIGEYLAARVLGEESDVEYDSAFRLKTEEPF